MIRYRTGHLAHEILGERLPLEVLESNAGYYIGTSDGDGPVSRESDGYYNSYEEAEGELNAGTFLQNWSV